MLGTSHCAFVRYVSDARVAVAKLVPPAVWKCKKNRFRICGTAVVSGICSLSLVCKEPWLTFKTKVMSALRKTQHDRASHRSEMRSILKPIIFGCLSVQVSGEHGEQAFASIAVPCIWTWGEVRGGADGSSADRVLFVGWLVG